MDRNVLLDEEVQTVSFAVPGVRLDPGGIGKGFALDRAVGLLHDSGVRMALLHGGTSTVVGVGTPPGSPDGWPVAVQHPRMPDARIITAYLRDAALSVSAIHGKSFWAQGRRFGHVLDPRTGRPVENPLLAAVTAPSATETDALSTALLVLGASGMERLRARFPGASFLVAEENRFAPNGLRVVTAGSAWNTLDGSSGSSEPEEQSAQPRE
jgi:thiamine biosynthesis lipoprotein